MRRAIIKNKKCYVRLHRKNDMLYLQVTFTNTKYFFKMTIFISNK